MADDQKETRPPMKRTSRKPDATGPIIVLALVVFFFVNGPGSHASARRGTTNEANFDETAILGGVDRQNSSSAFRGGDATAVMGGVKLDLRDAKMEGDEATVDVTTVMGGVELHIPREWIVVNHVTPVLGGVEDHTHAAGDAKKRLIIDGTVVMGGLQISN